MRWRSLLFALTALLWLAAGVGRYTGGQTDLLMVTPFLIAIFSSLAALLWWTHPRSRG